MLFLLASLAAATPALPARTGLPAHCDIPKVTFAMETERRNGLRRLGDEPPAAQYLAVDRRVGGCPAPAIVRTGIGR